MSFIPSPGQTLGALKDALERFYSAHPPMPHTIETSLLLVPNAMHSGDEAYQFSKLQEVTVLAAQKGLYTREESLQDGTLQMVLLEARGILSVLRNVFFTTRPLHTSLQNLVDSLDAYYGSPAMRYPPLLDSSLLRARGILGGGHSEEEMGLASTLKEVIAMIPPQEDFGQSGVAIWHLILEAQAQLLQRGIDVRGA